MLVLSPLRCRRHLNGDNGHEGLENDGHFTHFSDYFFCTQLVQTKMETPPASDRFHSSQAKKKWDNALYASSIRQTSLPVISWGCHSQLMTYRISTDMQQWRFLLHRNTNSLLYKILPVRSLLSHWPSFQDATFRNEYRLCRNMPVFIHGTL